MTKKQRNVVAALLKFGRSKAPRIRTPRKLRASAANSFLLRMMFNRSIDADLAWETGEWVSQSLTDPDDPSAVWKKLRRIQRRRLLGFLRYGYGGYALHRHYRTFAKELPKAATLILDKYDGDPRRIWNAKRNVPAVRELLEEIPGIGPALSRMTVLILARDYGLLGGKAALSQLDVKPDIHVVRVFKRSGLTKSHSPIEAIRAAREAYPHFPAALDPPAWKIGRGYCRPISPACRECPIRAACPKII
jgi:endonuclease-3